MVGEVSDVHHVAERWWWMDGERSCVWLMGGLQDGDGLGSDVVAVWVNNCLPTETDFLRVL